MRVTYPALLLALHPEYADLIYSGAKTAELRRVRPARSVRTAFVYETAPVGRVTGVVRIRKIESGTHQSIWRDYGRMLSITRHAFDTYLRGCPRPTVLMIDGHTQFRHHVKLRSVGGSERPPQSYCYIDPTDRAFASPD